MFVMVFRVALLVLLFVTPIYGKGIFLQISPTDTRSEIIKWLDQACDEGWNDSLVVQHTWRDGKPVNHLDAVMESRDCFDRLYLGLSYPLEYDGIPYFEGIKDSEFRNALLEQDKRAARWVAENFDDFHWYISFESNLLYWRDAGVARGYRSYLGRVTLALHTLNPSRILWSPNFWHQARYVPDLDELGDSIKGVLRQTHITDVHAQDHAGQSAHVRCEGGICFNTLPQALHDCRDIVAYHRLLAGGRQRVRVNLELFNGAYQPANPVEVRGRQHCAERHGVPVGASFSARYLYRMGRGDWTAPVDLENNGHAPDVRRIIESGISTGCSQSPWQYCPTNAVTRAQMAVFLVRALERTPESDHSFTDITGHWAEPWIAELAAMGITGGCGAGRYCPDSVVSRAQMAVFLVRAAGGRVGQHGSMFGDTMGHWAELWIHEAAERGYTGGCGNGNFCPSAPVTREQMASFIVRAFDA